MKRADALLGGVALLGCGAVAIALFTQYRLDMQPCPWCVLQRLIFLVAAAAALLGLAWRSTLGRRVSAALVLALAASGVASALWQHFVAASSASCNLTLADRIMAASGLDARLPEVFMATASCADAAVDLLGLPYEFWSLGVFVVIAAMATTVLRQPAQHRRP